jgi:hypothetical protein
MWSQSAKPPEHKNNAADPEHWKVDTEKMEDPAAEFRKQVPSLLALLVLKVLALLVQKYKRH